MKIVESQSAVLSNYEVLSHVTSTRAKPRSTNQKHKNVETLMKELNDYLLPHPDPKTPIPPYTHPHYSGQQIRDLIINLQQYSLMKAEVLMILNLRPQSMELLDCVVEDVDVRFSEEQQVKIIDIIGDILGRPVDGNGEMNGVEGDEEEARAGGVEI